MSFQYTYLLWVGLGAVVAAYFGLKYFEKDRLALLSRFASVKLLDELTKSVSWKRRHIKQWLILIVIALVFIALARPHVGYTWQEVKRRGHDILFAVDTSKSMLTPDINPDRLTRSKLAIIDMLEKLEGDRVGLIAFAGGSFLQCPLTIDYNAFRQTVEALDTNIIPRGGTDIAGAIREGIVSMSSESNDQKTLIIITDGEQLEGDALAMARQAAGKGIKIFTVGVGTPAGAVIPVQAQDGSTGLVRDAAGQPVRSQLNETLLAQIAEATGGFYSPLGQQGQALMDIYDKGLGGVEKKDIAEKMTRVPIERFQFPLVVAIILLMIEFLLSDRKSRAIPRPLPIKNKSLIILLCLAGLSASTGLRASPQEAEALYQQGKYEESQKSYSTAADKKASDYRLKFNAGSAAFKAGEYDTAEKDFNETLKSEDLTLQQKALYNLGNTFYRKGQPLAKDSPEKAIAQWEQALKSYEGALTLNDKDADAKFNHDYVKRKIEELKKKQEQEKQKDKNKQDQKKDDQKKDQDKQQQNQDQKNDQKSDQNKDQKKDGQQNDQKQDQGQNKEDKQDQNKKDDPGQNGQDQKKDGQDKDKDKNEGDKGDQPKKDKPEEKPGQDGGQPGDKKDQGKKPEETEGMQGAPQPGQLSKQQAIQLLDSMKDFEKKMPVFIDNPKNNEDQYKDW